MAKVKLNTERRQAPAPTADVQSFVVRVWIEDESARKFWRGHVTHVASNTRLHIDHLSQVTEFIKRYLAEMSVDFEEEQTGQTGR